MSQQSTKRPVGRPTRPGRRTEILDAAAKVVAERGIDTLTLSELANALGFSTYALTYHFGSKDQLLSAIVEHVETRLQAEITRLSADTSAAPAELLRLYWHTVREPEAQSYLRLWLELAVLADRHPERFPGFQERAVTGWRVLAADVLRRHTGSEALATLIVAAVTGLEIEFMLNPDLARLDTAIDLLAEFMQTRLPSDPEGVPGTRSPGRS